jgi:hypothetical protein
VRHRVDVAHDSVADLRLFHHFRAQPEARERRLQVVRDACKHHRAVVVGLRDLANHLIETVRQLPKLARPALGHGRRRLTAAEARDRLRERAQRLLQLPGGEKRGHDGRRKDDREPDQHAVARTRRAQRLHRHDDPVSVLHAAHPDARRRAGFAQAHVGAVRQAVADVFQEAPERRRDFVVRGGRRGLGHIRARRRDDPHARGQRLIRRIGDVLAHGVDEEGRLLDGVTRLALVALDADDREPRDM